jgi:hypothetical protein
MNFNFFFGHGHVTKRFDSYGFELRVDNYPHNSMACSYIHMLRLLTVANLINSRFMSLMKKLKDMQKTNNINATKK